MKGLIPSILAISALISFGAMMTYTRSSCSASSQRIERSQQAIQAAERVLLDHFGSHRLKLAPSGPELVAYIQAHSDCCVASKEFDWTYRDYVWFVDILLRKEGKVKEQVTVMLDACGGYVELWLLPEALH
jgi:hypothetical protein